MDASDVDDPVTTPYSGFKMDASEPPSLQQQPSPPHCSSTSPPTTSSITPDTNSPDTDPTDVSTADRIKLSVAALVAGRESATPVADHFTVLPGDSPNSRGESFAVRHNNPDQHGRLGQHHAIRHGLSSNSEKQWGMQGLLRSKAGTAGGAAADAKRKLSAHLGLSAKGGGGEEEQQQQSCEYVAMNTPCESPVAGAGERVDQEVSPGLAATCTTRQLLQHPTTCVHEEGGVFVWVCFSSNPVVCRSIGPLYLVVVRKRYACWPGLDSLCGTRCVLRQHQYNSSRISYFPVKSRHAFPPPEVLVDLLCVFALCLTAVLVGLVYFCFNSVGVRVQQ